MSERKAINKWYPPDWDPSKAPKKAKKSNANEKVRLMLPFSMKCLQCGEYIAARRKFNAKKEVTPDRYMGIKIIKFHIKCPRCNNGIIFRTDPKLSGFVPVEGGARNYDSTTGTKIKPMETEDEIFARLEKEDEENQKFHEQQNKRKHNPFWLAQEKDTSKDSMANLEQKLVEQQKEQEMHDHLAYLQARTQRMQQSGGSDHIAGGLRDKLAEKRKLDTNPEEDDKIKELFAKKSAGHPQIVGGVISIKRRDIGKNKNTLRELNLAMAQYQLTNELDANQKMVETRLQGQEFMLKSELTPASNKSPTPTKNNSAGKEDISNSSEVLVDSKQANPQLHNMSSHSSSSDVASENTGMPTGYNSGLSALAGYSSEEDD